MKGLLPIAGVTPSRITSNEGLPPPLGLVMNAIGEQPAEFVTSSSAQSREGGEGGESGESDDDGGDSDVDGGGGDDANAPGGGGGCTGVEGSSEAGGGRKSHGTDDLGIQQPQ